jgi:hypothetical protein
MGGDKAVIAAGSRILSPNLSIIDGESETNVSNSTLCADIRGGGMVHNAGANNSTYFINKSIVNISNTTIDGYSDKNNNTWTGRVFGAGYLQSNTNTKYTQNESFVAINNVGGKTYDKDNENVVNEDPGTRVYGGGQSQQTTRGVHTVNNTHLTISGSDTKLQEAYGGSIISGTVAANNTGVVVVGTTDVRVEGGLIKDFLVGGNNSNWFGYSVIGNAKDPLTPDATNGFSQIVKNASKFNQGSTHITITGGDLSTAKVVGGSYADFGVYGYANTYSREAYVYGTTNIDIFGGEIGTIVGAGVSEFYANTNINNSSPTISNLTGNSIITVSGGEVADIYGGGYASSSHSSAPTQANTIGNTAVNISGGTIGDIYGGGYANNADANITGNTNITISGGTIKGNIYAGGYAEGGSQSNTATANVIGTGTVTFLKNADFTGTVFGSGNAVTPDTSAATVTNSTLAFGNANTIYNDAFSGKFKDFDNISAAKGSTVKLGDLNDSNLTKATTNFTGAGIVEASSLTATAGHKVNITGTLNVTGAFKNAADNITGAGVLGVNASNVLNGTSLVANVNKITMTGGTVNFLDGVTFANADAAKAAKGNLLAAGVLWNNVKITAPIKPEEKPITIVDKNGNTKSETVFSVENADLLNADQLKDATVTSSSSQAGKAEFAGSQAGTIAVDTTATGSDTKKAVTVSFTTSPTSTITLTGDGTDLVKGSTNATLSVGNKTLNLGNAGVSGAGGTVAKITTGESGTLNVINGAYTVTEVTFGNTTETATNTVDAGATLNSEKVTTSASTLEVTGGSQLNVTKADGKGSLTLGGNLNLDKGAVVIADSLTATNGKTITVGSTEGGAGTLITKEANLKGASIFLDPAWKDGNVISDASKAVLNFDAATGINGKLTAGQNSFIVLGDMDTKWAENTFANSGLTWGEDNVTAALFVRTSQTFTADNNKGGILVDGTKTSAPQATEVQNKVVFADKSLLVVDGIAMAGDKAALVGNGTVNTLTVDKGSKLLIANGKAGDTVHIVSGFKGSGSDNKIDGWSGANLTTDSKLLTAKETAKFNTTSGTYSVSLEQNSATSIFPKLDKNLGGLVDTMVREIGLDTNSANYGQRFISRATSDSFGVATNAKKAAATIEGAAKIGFAGAAPQMAMQLTNAAGNIPSLRNSFAAAPQGAAVAMNEDGVIAHEGLSAGDGMKNGFGLWVMPTYQNQQAFGLESGEFETGYKSNAAGVALGADYTFNDMFRVGAQFNVGGGYAESTGDFNSTDNRFNYWGLGLYAGYQYENIGVTADFGYSSNNNEIEQSLPSSMQMAALKADAKTDTITVGLRGEYKFATEALDIVPHIGVRMTNMHMGSFDVKSDKEKVFKADDVNATVWTFPVGVTFSKDIETSNGWTVKPSLDLAVVPAAGDIEAKQDMKIAGVSGSAQVESSIMDSISYQGSLGLSAKHDNGVSVGINYTLQAGAHTTDHGVQATFRYDF